LIIYGLLDQPARLAWQFEIHVSVTRAWRVIVDALDGSLRARISIVKDAAVTGGAPDATGANRALNLWQDGATYYMVDTSKKMFDPASTPPNNGRGTIEIYDAAN
jgi:Zn-dependent metalloprotease